MTDEAAPQHPETTPAPLLDPNTLGRDILSAMVDELKAAPDCWQKMSQAQQDQTIARLRQRVQSWLAATVRILVSGESPATPATMTSISSRKGIRVLLAVARSAPNRHQLLDAIDQDVLLVVASHEAYTGRMAEVKALAQQPDLFQDSGIAEGTNYTGGDERPYRRDEPGSTPEVPYDPDAPAPELELEKGPLWEQARDALAAVGIKVNPTIACDWTHNQCAQAAFWAQRKEADPDVTPEPPPFVQEAVVEDDDDGEDDDLPTQPTGGPPDDTQ